MNSPHSTPSDQQDFGSDFLVPPKSHGQNQPTLASTLEIFFFYKSSPSFFASSRETLETSLFYPPRTTNFHINGNEATQFALDQRNNDRGERDIPPPASTEPPYTQGAGASDRARSLVESCSKKCTSKGSEVTRRGHCKEGQCHPSRGCRRLVLRTDTRGVSRRSDPPVRRSGKQRLGFGQRFRVRSLGGPKESCRVDHGQCSKKNSHRESGHSHRCLAPLPPISLLSEGVPTI